MSVETIKFANGQTLQVIDGQYVIGAGGACKQESCTKGKILQGEYWLDNCRISSNCDCEKFKAWWIDNIGEWGTYTDPLFGNTVTFTTCSDFNNPHTAYDGNDYNMLFLQGDFTTISEDICAMDTLQVLYLINTPNLVGVPDSLGNMKNLEALAFWYIPATAISNNIYTMKNIKQFGIASCDNLTSISDKIGNMTNLTELWIDNNSNLSVLPDSIGNLTNLTELDISSNQLTSLPDNIHNLDNSIININLEYNNFTDDYSNYIRNDLFPIANASGNLAL